MREFFQRHRSALLAFLGLTLPLFLLFVHGRHPRKTTVVEVALMEVTGPVQQAASRALSGITGIWDGYVALVGLSEENASLREQIRELTEQADRVRQLEDENRQLRRMLEFGKERRELVTVGAHVIGKDISPYGRVLRVALDIGADLELLEGMPVVTPDGLVGRIHRVSGSFAEVMLTVDARSTVNVKAFGKGVVGTVTGVGSQTNYNARMSYLHRAEGLAPGDLLVTSGHDKVFPPNIRVGFIRAVEERQRGVEYELQVTPAVNFSDLELVQVIVDVRSQPVAEGAPDGAGEVP